MERRINFLFLAHSIRASACRYVERWWYVLSSSLPDWISITKTPFSYILISYPLKDEFSFLSASICWINKIIFFCTPRIGTKAPWTVGVGFAVTNCIDNGIRTPSKSLKSWPKQIVANIQKKLLPRSTTSYSFWLSLSSCSYINFANVQVTVIAACFMCPATSFRFSRLKMGYQNALKTWQIYLWTTCESFENLLFHQFPILVISSKCDIKIEKWAYINPDKSGRASAEQQRNPRSFNSRFLFSMIIFVWIFLKMQILSCLL